MVKQRPDYYEASVVRQAAKSVTMHASTLGSLYIKDGVYRSKFIRDVDRWGQCLVNDYNNGNKSKDEVLSSFKREIKSLTEQGQVVTQKGAGFVAGVMMVMGSAATCVESAGVLCAISTPVLAHGLNNVYENGKYFYDGDANAIGWVRDFYQKVAISAGNFLVGNGEEWRRYGDIAYYGVDLSMSVYGVLAKSSTLIPISLKNTYSGFRPIPKINSNMQMNTSWTRYAKAKKFKLFRYSSEDYLRGYQASSKFSLLVEAGSDKATAESLYKTYKNND
ncbi:DUF4225 domain-containing protein [Vibrio alginolyticus]|uniref:DUF4225 domain-containing protein n=1 Tax=Vibrio alginolyticus TaxID=663 RepID=UPI00211A56D1|nr:DUF4225 domain-containing protein [Vibrio alginolyticus]MCQ9091228.1 DUF4225 domain-containing protein [Vibrio alginolyticus]